MRIIVYDIEVLKHDWLAVFYDVSRDEWTMFHNEPKGFCEYMTQPDAIYCGFNNKHYDNHIVKAICCGADNSLIKQINDFIIVDERPGWEHYFLRQNRFWFESFDIMDDTRIGISLKHIEAHLGMPIEETPIDFDREEPLEPKEVKDMFHYNKHDVKATAIYLTLRKNYLDCKIQLGALCGTPLPPSKALYYTNARLAAKYLDATYVERFDGREYEYPKNLRVELIPQEILDFFNQIRDLSIPDHELFNRRLTITIGGCPCTYAWGGVHGSLTQYHPEKDDDIVIQNRDVGSLYPSLLDLYNYISRNCSDPNKFRNTKNERLEAKRMGDKKKANTLKNPLNVTSGAMDQPTNPLYDPKMARSMRISGQLFLTELVMELIGKCSTFKLINFNTDGLMYAVHKSELPLVDSICAAWEERTQFELETDHIAENKVWVKDVNNLMFIDTKGKIKTVGAYLNYGITEKGGWSINNNYTIVKDAVIAYFAYGTPVEETIYGCDDMFKFQVIAKAGGGYKSVFRVPPDFEERKNKWKRENRYRVTNKDGKQVWKYPSMKWYNYDGPRCEVQRVNRVYASTKPNMGTLAKVKPDGTVGKVSDIPDNCIIDNKNKLSISDVDKSWYVDLAKKYIEDYLGVGV